MGQKICDYCGGSGRDAVTPSRMSCWKCHGMGGYWEPDPVPVGKARSTRGTTGRPRREGSQYRPLPFMQSLLDQIPRWLKWCSAVGAAVVGLGIGQKLDPSSDVATWAFGGLGALLGYVALPVLVVLTDVAMQLTVLLVKLAVVVTILAGVAYALWLFAA